MKILVCNEEGIWYPVIKKGGLTEFVDSKVPDLFFIGIDKAPSASFHHDSSEKPRRVWTEEEIRRLAKKINEEY